MVVIRPASSVARRRRLRANEQDRGAAPGAYRTLSVCPVGQSAKLAGRFSKNADTASATAGEWIAMIC
jgi:hypothetical protein